MVMTNTMVRRVEVIGNGLNEELDAGHAGVELRGDAGDGGCPRGDRRDHADRRGGGVNEVGELHAGDALAVGHGGHDGADGEAVEVVVDEDQHAEGEGGEQGADDDADEEGGVGLLRQQGKADGDDRGNEGPEGVDKHEGFSFRASAQKI